MTTTEGRVSVASPHGHEANTKANTISSGFATTLRSLLLYIVQIEIKYLTNIE